MNEFNNSIATNCATCNGLSKLSSDHYKKKKLSKAIYFYTGSYNFLLECLPNLAPSNSTMANAKKKKLRQQRNRKKEWKSSICAIRLLRVERSDPFDTICITRQFFCVSYNLDQSRKKHRCSLSGIHIPSQTLSIFGIHTYLYLHGVENFRWTNSFENFIWITGPEGPWNQK